MFTNIFHYITKFSKQIIFVLAFLSIMLAIIFANTYFKKQKSVNTTLKDDSTTKNFESQEQIQESSNSSDNLSESASLDEDEKTSNEETSTGNEVLTTIPETSSNKEDNNSIQDKDDVSIIKEYLVSLSVNYAKPSETITVSINNPPKQSSTTYKWYVDSKLISNTKNSYTPTSNDEEKFIKVIVSTTGEKDFEKTLYCSKLPVLFLDTKENINKDASVIASADSSFYSGETDIRVRGNSTSLLPKLSYKLKLDKKTDIFGFGSNKHWVLLANYIDSSMLRNKIVNDFSSKIGMEVSMQSKNVVLILNGKYQGVYQLCEHVRIGSSRIDIFDWEDIAEEVADNLSKKLGSDNSLSKDKIKSTNSEIEDLLLLNMNWITTKKFTYKSVTYNITTYLDQGTTLPSATGGFLAEMDFYASLEQRATLMTNYTLPLYFSKPENLHTATVLKNYAKNYIQAFEYSLHSPNFILNTSSVQALNYFDFYDDINGRKVYEKTVNLSNDTSLSSYNGLHYSDLFDMNSLVTNFLTCEFSMNWDSMKNSFFLYKDIDKKAKIGPVWDYDWAFGNANMFFIDTLNSPYSNEYQTNETAKQWHTSILYYTREWDYQSVQWNLYLMKDPYFLGKVYENYKQKASLAINDVIKTNGIIDSELSLMSTALSANDKLWMKTNFNDYRPNNHLTNINNLKNYIKTRYSWLETQFTSTNSFINSLAKSNVSTGVYLPSNKIKVTVNSDKTKATITTTDSNVKYVEVVQNGKSLGRLQLTNNTITLNIANTNSSYDTLHIIGLNNAKQYIYNTSKQNTLLANHIYY